MRNTSLRKVLVPLNTDLASITKETNQWCVVCQWKIYTYINGLNDQKKLLRLSQRCVEFSQGAYILCLTSTISFNIRNLSECLENLDEGFICFLGSHTLRPYSQECQFKRPGTTHCYTSARVFCEYICEHHLQVPLWPSTHLGTQHD